MDDIKTTITSITNTIARTSSELIKSTKLSINISNEETNLKNEYYEIGKKVHEIYTYGGSLGQFFDEKYLEISKIENKLKELKEQLDIAKGTKTCVNCGKTADRNSEFCPKCGNNIDIKPVENIVVANNNVTQNNNYNGNKAKVTKMVQETLSENEIKNTKKCKICGNLNDENDKVCLFCGRFIN